MLTVPTRLLRIQKRSGLVPARLLGAEQAKGDVLTFLDAHCECTRGWLEPLLQRVKESRSSVVAPVIDIISDDNFSYTKTFENHWGAFNWQLSFRWFGNKRSIAPNNADPTQAITSPAMAGGLFAVDKRYFFEIGAYDKEMRVGFESLHCILNENLYYIYIYIIPFRSGVAKTLKCPFAYGSAAGVSKSVPAHMSGTYSAALHRTPFQVA